MLYLEQPCYPVFRPQFFPPRYLPTRSHYIALSGKSPDWEPVSGIAARSLFLYFCQLQAKQSHTRSATLQGRAYPPRHEAKASHCASVASQFPVNSRSENDLESGRAPQFRPFDVNQRSQTWAQARGSTPNSNSPLSIISSSTSTTSASYFVPLPV